MKKPQRRGYVFQSNVAPGERKISRAISVITEPHAKNAENPRSERAAGKSVTAARARDARNSNYRAARLRQ